MTQKTHQSPPVALSLSAHRPRRQVGPAFFVLLIAAAFFVVSVSSASAKMLPGVEFGMSYKEVRKILRQVKRDNRADFTKTITNISLGLDFMHGAPVFTVDTGVTMANTWGYYPMFFYKDRLFGVKRNINTMREFTALKNAYPQGRYRFHRFPSYERQQRIFLLHTNSLYGFTNHHNDLYLYDEGMRREIIANVRGSFCWHTKLYSPNLQKFIANYSQCVENRPIPAQQLAEDHQSCQQYCEDTPEMFSSEQCLSICDEAYQEVLRVSAER
ncbi:hypothetical protein DPQ33_05835 [Oceanidesulfovibrio indonesiensis]|uniref:Uncharacterized protein n=1 Tax=Oceanidesulfovibrio indonesiensis TaxID=54767 RepID=A0A7M3MG25_9BACT|nr:hypothetical protein [Oceanidesulfovibrio indonesiensis]TVM18273.1 hypothetical protein DPQ33_05835 [Oceanidesulfovibrio indonesiensis]